MTKQSPRIYVYKITFLEVLHYYYGYHKEKIFNEYYMGSPVTNKDFWEFYTPMKEIIKEFPFTDEGYKEAREFENSLIKPVYNTDPLCLNEHCGGMLSLDVCIKGGKKAGQKSYELGIGVHGISPEEQLENAKKGGQKAKELGVGIHARTKEQMTKDGKKGAQTNKENGTGIFSMSFEDRSKLGKRNGKQHYENGTGIFSLTKEERTEIGRRSGQKCKKLGIGVCGLNLEERKRNGEKVKELGIGFFGLTKEEQIENSRKGGKNCKEKGVGFFALTTEQRQENGKISGKKAAKITNSQVWECTVTGYRSNPGALSRYQKKRGIDTSNRIRIQ